MGVRGKDIESKIMASVKDTNKRWRNNLKLQIIPLQMYFTIFRSANPITKKLLEIVLTNQKNLEFGFEIQILTHDFSQKKELVLSY